MIILSGINKIHILKIGHDNLLIIFAYQINLKGSILIIFEQLGHLGFIYNQSGSSVALKTTVLFISIAMYSTE